MRGGGVPNGRGGRAIALLLLFGSLLCAGAQGKPTSDSVKKDALPSPSAADKQKAMQADMDRLLQLAIQLKGEVDGSRRDELSIKVVRDADEIDKLARSARGRVR